MSTTMQAALQRRAPALFDPMLLQTPDGCDEAEKAIRSEKVRLTSAINTLEQKRSLLPEEGEVLSRYRGSLTELEQTRRAVKERKLFLLEDRHMTFERAYVEAGKENLPVELHDALVRLAQGRVDAAKARAAIANTVGSAIGVLGAAGSPRERKS